MRKLLVVDDEDDVHSATRYALAGFLPLNRPITLISACDSAAAKRVFEANSDIALALVDIRVLDHLIVAGDVVTSLAERGVL